MIAQGHCPFSSVSLYNEWTGATSHSDHSRPMAGCICAVNQEFSDYFPQELKAMRGLRRESLLAQEEQKQVFLNMTFSKSLDVSRHRDE